MSEEEFDGDLSKPRKVHCKSKWKHTQDAVNWIHMAKAQEKGLTFWQTRSHAIFVHDSVPADCIEKIFENRENSLYQRLSMCRSAPKRFLKVSGT